MRNFKTTYLTREDDLDGYPYDSIKWLFEVHIQQPDTKQYSAAVLYGNEDDPSRIDLYTQKQPKITDTPALVWPPQDNE